MDASLGIELWWKAALWPCRETKQVRGGGKTPAAWKHGAAALT